MTESVSFDLAQSAALQGLQVFRAQFAKTPWAKVPSEDLWMYLAGWVAAARLQRHPELVPVIRAAVERNRAAGFEDARLVAEAADSDEPMARLLEMLRGTVDSQLPLSGFPWRKVAEAEAYQPVREIVRQTCPAMLYDPNNDFGYGTYFED